jgi:CspA family cold shock protein
MMPISSGKVGTRETSEHHSSRRKPDPSCVSRPVESLSEVRTNVNALEVRMTGKIRTLRVDKGFGFIKDDGGNEYFFHQSAVYGEGLQDLREGDSVEFEVGQGPKGPRAENVRRTST